MVAIDSFGERDEILSVGLVPEIEGKGHKRVLLVPFEMAKWSPRLLEAAAKAAEGKKAEIVLVCIRSPVKSLRDAQEQERLFSALKGLQAQLQNRTIAARIEYVAGPAAQFVLDFAGQDEVDMLLLPGHRAATHFGDNELFTA